MTATSQKVSLTVSLLHTKGKGKTKTLTTGFIKMGPVLLATSPVLPGRWNGDQILSEYRKAPGRFKVTEAGQTALSALLA